MKEETLTKGNIMEKMTKKERFKKFTEDHTEDIATFITFAAASGVVLVLLKKIADTKNSTQTALTNYNTWADQQNEWIDKQHDDGKVVYLLHDSSYLTIPKDTPVEWTNSNSI